MDVDGFLNLERRTGVKNSDIDDFNDKASAVHDAIQGMLNGTLDPKDVKIDGIDTEEEIIEKERARLERLRIQKEKTEQLRVQRKEEEKKKWWEGARLLKPRTEDQDPEEEEEEQPETKEGIDDTAIRAGRYNFDYSRWDTWVPNDEATNAEKAEQEQLLEVARNKEFEKNNADFCGDFLADMRKREEGVLKKREDAEKARLKGNKLFKAREFQRAAETYMEALKLDQFDTKTLTNLAQVHIRSKEYDDALEFLARTLYLERDHVKALSRKAFILSETGKNVEAQETMQQALVIDPTNTDLITQAREIDVTVREVRDEAQTEATTDQSVFNEVENLKQYLLSSVTPLVEQRALFSTSSSKEVVSKATAQLKLLRGRLDMSPNEFGSDTDTSSKTLLQVYIRKNCLMEVVIYLKYAVEQLKNCGSEDKDVIATAVGAAINFVAAAIESQRASKMLALEAKLISTVKPLLRELSHLPLIQAVVYFIRNCCKDDVCQKTRAAIFADKQVVIELGSVIGNLSFCRLFQGKKENSEALENKEKIQVVTTILQSAHIVKEITFADQNTVAKDALSPESSSVVCALATALHVLEGKEGLELESICKNLKTKGIASLAEEREGLVETLLGLSQHVPMRDAFALPLPFEDEDETGGIGDGSEATKKKENNEPRIPLTTAGVLVKRVLAIQTVAQMLSYGRLGENARVTCSNCLATLMNACIQGASGAGAGATPAYSVAEAVVAAGGQDICVPDLSLSDADRSTKDGNVLLRKAGLLSRIIGLETVQKKLLEAAHYRGLCRRVMPPKPISKTSSGEVEKWQVDEHSHYVRVLAAIPAAAQKTDALKSIALQEQLVVSLLHIFPVPRMDLGEVTAETVTRMPNNPVPALILGNAARSLLACADDPKQQALLYQKEALLGVEKIICAMATCTDMRVRKNLAILLAKGCGVEGGRDKITKLRGMEMLVQLQDKL